MKPKIEKAAPPKEEPLPKPVAAPVKPEKEKSIPEKEKSEEAPLTEEKNLNQILICTFSEKLILTQSGKRPNLL